VIARAAKPRGPGWQRKSEALAGLGVLLIAVVASGCGGKKRTPQAHEDAGVAVISGGGSGSGSTGASGSASVQVAGAFDQKCVAGDLEACRNLAVMYTEGVGVQRDERRAAALFAQACNGGLLAGCNHLALVLAEGLGSPKDVAKAVELYQRACDGGYGLACRNLGLLLRDGRGIDKDLARAERLLDKACKAGTPFGCTNAGDLDRMLVASQDRAPRLKKMIDHYKLGCDGGDPIGCRYIGIAYLEGTGLPKSASAASVWLERGCVAKPSAAGKGAASGAAAGVGMTDAVACRVLGMMKVQGVGGTRDVEHGRQALQLACDRHDDEACKALAAVSQVSDSRDAGVPVVPSSTAGDAGPNSPSAPR